MSYALPKKKKKERKRGGGGNNAFVKSIDPCQRCIKPPLAKAQLVYKQTEPCRLGLAHAGKNFIR